MPVSQNLNILIVDETKSQLMAVKEVLRTTGFTNINAAEGAEDALKRIQSSLELNGPIELIICNNELSEIDGVALFNKIRTIDAHRRTPFLLLCSSSEKEVIMGAVKAGIRHILLRPFSKQSLVNELSKLLG